MKQENDSIVPDQTPEQIQAGILKKISTYPAEGSIAKEDLPLFNQARAGILHMLAVRQHRLLRHKVKPALSISGHHDQDMREGKIVRRLLSGKMETYMIDPDPKWEREDFTSNPYTLTPMTKHMTEKEIKHILETATKELDFSERATREHLNKHEEIVKLALKNLCKHEYIAQVPRPFEAEKRHGIGRGPEYTPYAITESGMKLFPDLLRATESLIAQANSRSVVAPSKEENVTANTPMISRKDSRLLHKHRKSQSSEGQSR